MTQKLKRSSSKVDWDLLLDNIQEIWYSIQGFTDLVNFSQKKMQEDMWEVMVMNKPIAYRTIYRMAKDKGSYINLSSIQKVTRVLNMCLKKQGKEEINITIKD